MARSRRRPFGKIREVFMKAFEIFVTCAVTGGARVLDAAQTRERLGLLDRRRDAPGTRHARVR
jgi:hypothetical protein